MYGVDSCKGCIWAWIEKEWSNKGKVSWILYDWSWTWKIKQERIVNGYWAGKIWNSSKVEHVRKLLNSYKKRDLESVWWLIGNLEKLRNVLELSFVGGDSEKRLISVPR